MRRLSTKGTTAKIEARDGKKNIWCRIVVHDALQSEHDLFAVCADSESICSSGMILRYILVFALPMIETLV